MVDAILKAAEQVFAARGFDDATLHRVATYAGVSVGSIYQYFPDKDALLVELAHRSLRERSGALQASLVELANVSFQEALPAILTRYFEAIERGHAFKHVLTEHLPRLGTPSDTTYETWYADEVGRFVRERAQLSGEVAQHTTFTLLHGVEGVLDGVARTRQNLLAQRGFVRHHVEWIARLLRAA